MSVVERRQRRNTTAAKKIRESFLAIAKRCIGDARSYSFRRRRVVAAIIVAVAILLVSMLSSLMHTALLQSNVMTGWVLMACLVMLILIGVRRRIPVLPLGTMSTWTQVHLYTGLFAFGVFVLHVPAIAKGQWIASGYLEGWLSGLFVLVSGSGVYGLIASRRLPWRLTHVGEQVRFDLIPWHREQITNAVNREIESLANPASLAVIGEFHRRYLGRYFDSKPSLWYLAVPTSLRRRRTLAGLVELNRYLEEEGIRASGRLAELVRRRDDLDYQYALQWRLRAWVMVHGTASILLLVLAVIHGLLAMRFVES